MFPAPVVPLAPWRVELKGEVSHQCVWAFLGVRPFYINVRTTSRAHTGVRPYNLMMVCDSHLPSLRGRGRGEALR